MPKKALPNSPDGNTVKPEPKTKGALLFTAEKVDRSTMPEPGKRGGRRSNVPAIEGFLNSLTEPGTYEMRSPDEDGAHPVNRITQIRKVAGSAYKVETSPIEAGKRYRVFVTVTPEQIAKVAAENPAQ